MTMSLEDLQATDWRVTVYLCEPLEAKALPPYFGSNQPTGDTYNDAIRMAREAAEDGFYLFNADGSITIYPSHRVVDCRVFRPGKHS